MPSKSYELETLPKKIIPDLQVNTLPFSKANPDYYAEDKDNKDVPERGVWAKSIQSLLLCISMSVGLGNVWRFPNVAYNNGGAIRFRILVMDEESDGRKSSELLHGNDNTNTAPPAGISTAASSQLRINTDMDTTAPPPASPSAMELSKSAIQIYALKNRHTDLLFVIQRLQRSDNPAKGLMIKQMTDEGAFLIPYLILLVIIGRPLYYLELILGQFSSQGPIKLWRVVPAFKGIGYAQVISVSFVVIFYNYLMALSVFYIYSSMKECLPWTSCHINHTNLTAEYFWKNEVLEEDPKNTDVLTHISWKLALCLFITWIIVYVSVIQGTDSLGKMAYFTAIFPYIVLTALLIVALQGDGAAKGIVFFFMPDVKKLADIKVWYKACEQSFFSLAIGYGNIVMIASYNKFKNNVYRHAIIISVLDTFTNVLAGCVIFAVLGNLAYERDLDISEVVNHEDLGLAFIIYPEALANIKFIPQLWSVLFFVMLFTLGIGSSMSQLETVLTVIKDKFPAVRDFKWMLSLGTCTLFFLLGLPLTTNVGQHILVLLNNYGVSAAVYFYATLEIIGIMWIYGIRNFLVDVKFMTGTTPGIFWKITWAFTAPLALIKIKNSLKATKDWGPSDPVDRAGWLAVKKAVPV
ncbi:sodium-dependent nutrient amino acid transporter 1-like isoform X2 [Stegodyphus dumicola]|uniref:sodium-dependent nutrient amino acid transporter 1-like isoform X2 n=1 Tax=Stegodyphus dumicola TaxID=202533 RepID=UPI0015ACC9C0|nr:sodium-dependent nutrient amino acid transporter 1-like isoform X2 [Stegodyphus dumicola]